MDERRAPDPRLGVIEGFYGQPWLWPDRARMVEFMAQHGFGLYVYAPKDDPLHRAQWRDLYLPEELVRFRRLLRLCRKNGIELVYGLSPIDLARRGKDDLGVLLHKAEQMRELGVRSFCLLFDDLPAGLPGDDAGRAAVARHQARTARELHRSLTAAGADGRYIFAPTEYHGTGESAYLATLGEELPLEYDVFWTGPQVCSRTITLGDLRAVRRSLRRAPLLWDNYPVNDGDMRHDPHLRPLQGRAVDLPRAVAGIVANPALQPEASKVALNTLATYWTDPAVYEPEAAWSVALRAVAGNRADADALRVLGQLARRSPLEPGQAKVVPPTIAEFWRRWEAGGAHGRDDRRRALREVDALLASWGRAAARLQDGMANRRLARDLDPWARKLQSWSEAARGGVELLRAALREPFAATLADARRETLARLEAVRRRTHRVADEQLEAFIRRCFWEAAALARQVGEPLADELAAEAAS